MSAENKQSAEERLRQEFNDWARAGRGESMEKGHRPAGEQALARLELSPDAVVLDIGCGSGWATRLMAAVVTEGRAVGIDISDEMIRLAQEASVGIPNVEFHVSGAEKLPLANGEFTHGFSMESLYYYEDVLVALKEIHRVLRPGGKFVAVVDLYEENKPSHQWIDQLNVPVHLLSSQQYRELFERAGFSLVNTQRIKDPTPVPENYSGGSFKTREDFQAYRDAGSLMILGFS